MTSKLPYVMLMLVILLQAIWLPLHGIPYEDTPLWAGIYMLPTTVGFILMGPLSGWLSDRYGARGFSTLGMAISAVMFLILTTFPYNFDYTSFAIALFVMGLAMGMFASPNTASIMNSVSPDHRGSAAGMRSTLQNSGSTIGLSLLFTITLIALYPSHSAMIRTSANEATAPSDGNESANSEPERVETSAATKSPEER